MSRRPPDLPIDLPNGPVSDLPTPDDPGAMVPVMPYQDADGKLTRVVPETADEFSLVQRFAVYDQRIRDRLLAFEKRKDFLSDVFTELEARSAGSSSAYPSDYDEYLKKMLRKV